MKVSGDLDDKLFFENMLFNMDRNREVEPFVKTIQDSSLAEQKKKAAREQVKLVDDRVLAFQENWAIKTAKPPDAEY